MKASPPDHTVIDWLLAGDPSIRWQVHRDLLGSSERAVEKERRNVQTEGWGARLLTLQDPGGTWASGFYTPKWTSTFYTMLLLRDLGLPSSNGQARRAAALLLDRGLRPDGGMHFPNDRPSETCISGMTLSIGAYFGAPRRTLGRVVAYILAEQMTDGGWNCRRRRGATHSSVHTTISALEGLRTCEQLRVGGRRAVRAAQRRGREFLLAHRLFRSHRTGAIMRSEFTRFSYPPRWHYDVLRALDYFQSVRAPKDERLADAIDMVRARRQADGRWLLEHTYGGRTYFALERVGAPGRWNTLRAMRVLQWWERAEALT
jgi:hypothetical protein